MLIPNIIGICMCPLFRGPLIISVCVCVCPYLPYLAKCLSRYGWIRIYKLITRGPLTRGHLKSPTSIPDARTGPKTDTPPPASALSYNYTLLYYMYIIWFCIYIYIYIYNIQSIHYYMYNISDRKHVIAARERSGARCAWSPLSSI